MAEGAFAPGHLGELTQFIPFEMVDEALAQTGRTQARVRDLPARVVVYLVLAGCLFSDRGYGQVWHRLVAGLHGLTVATPTAAALTHARRRLGAAPLKALFDLLRGPSAPIAAAGVRWRGLLVTAIDGTTMTVPDTATNLGVFTKQTGSHGGSGYPLLRLMVVVCCGTRTIIDAAFGSALIGETRYAPPLLARSLRRGMIVLADRNFAARQVITAITDAGADLLIRCKDNRKLPVLQRHRDGSYLSMWDTTPVRVIEAEVTIATSNGRRTGTYRLVTTLLDPGNHPAIDLVKLYHQRWEIESAYLAIKSTILGGHVLRARTPEGITQEVYALLITYQVLRQAMTDATDTQPGTDPDRASFTIALNAARDQLIQATGVIAGTVIDLVGHIGRLVLANLLPPRRTRLGPRTVKRSTSKYPAKGPNTNRTTYQATINIDILTPPP
ncbi:IS4 family transposase [Kribbella sp. NBC_01245]|uniref:IS4 family transposase n=1 Tax=Kribbella sp. NBC_01245 TaxID=2903578 RepID=UPI002E29BA7A|nr:IS4 family transposase [Kribbella sp. NBC_01245]